MRSVAVPVWYWSCDPETELNGLQGSLRLRTDPETDATGRFARSRSGGAGEELERTFVSRSKGDGFSARQDPLRTRRGP